MRREPKHKESKDRTSDNITGTRWKGSRQVCFDASDPGLGIKICPFWDTRDANGLEKKKRKKVQAIVASNGVGKTRGFK